MHPDDLTGEHMGVHQESSAPGSLTQNAQPREACGRMVIVPPWPHSAVSGSAYQRTTDPPDSRTRASRNQ